VQSLRWLIEESVAVQNGNDRPHRSAYKKHVVTREASRPLIRRFAETQNGPPEGSPWSARR
jgi:hypothetical protein